MPSAKVVETDAILVRSTDYGDSHRILTLLTSELGKTSAMARGAKRSKRRFPPGMLQPFQLLRVVLKSHQGGDLLLLVEADVVRTFPSVPGDPARYAYASYLVELVRELTPLNELDAGPLRLLLRFLTHLEEEGAKPVLLASFVLLSLQLAGLSPSLDRCADCGKAAPRGSAGRFDVIRGIVCSDCGPAAPILRGTTREGLLSLSSGDTPLDLSDEEVGTAIELLIAFSHHQLGRELHSASLLRRFLERAKSRP